MTDAKAIPRHGNLGPDACILVEKLKDGKPGDIVSDEELTKLCGKPTEPHGIGYPALMSAIRYTVNTFGVRWKRIRGEKAISVLKPSERVEEEYKSLGSIRRATRRTLRMASTVDTKELDEAQKTRHFAVMAQYGAIELMAKPQTTQAIESKQTYSVPNLTHVLELFG